VSAGRPLPREIATRLADLRRHYEALQHALDGVDAAAFAAAARARDPGELGRAYVIERPFELLANYVVELAREGLEAAGLLERGAAVGGAECLRALAEHRGVSAARAGRLLIVHRARNDLQHEYPGARSQATWEAARLLADELPGFLRDYARWLRSLGFGPPGA